jgi:hypothetical protein
MNHDIPARLRLCDAACANVVFVDNFHPTLASLIAGWSRWHQGQEAGGEDTRAAAYPWPQCFRVGIRKHRQGEGAMDGRYPATGRSGRATVAQPDRRAAPTGLEGGESALEGVCGPFHGPTNHRTSVPFCQAR